MQRFIDRIKDAREGSHVKTWDLLYDKLQRVVIEMREDAHEESVRRTLSLTKPKQDRPKGDGKGKDVKANVAVDTDDKGEKARKAEAKGQGWLQRRRKRKGRWQAAAKDCHAKATGSSNKAQGNAKAEAIATQNRSSVPCLFYPNNGTCNRGESCPFFHDPKAKPAAKTKATAVTSSAKATVAVISAAQGVSRASAVPSASQTCASSGSGWEVFQASLRAFARPFIALASLFSCIGQPQLSAHSAALWASPAVVSHNSSVALSAKMSDSFELGWIADSGAGRDLASEFDFLEQGVPISFVQSFTQSCKPIKFETGNGTYVSDSCIEIPGSTFGKASFQLMDDCPLVRSLGRIVKEEKRPFIWIPGSPPFFDLNPDSVQVTADASSIIRAARVEDGVPIFSETFTTTSSHAPAAGGSAEPEVPGDVIVIRDDGIASKTMQKSQWIATEDWQ